MSTTLTGGAAAIHPQDDKRPGEAPWTQWRAEEAVMRWYGWGSPIGFSIALLSFSAAVLMLRHAIFG